MPVGGGLFVDVEAEVVPRVEVVVDGVEALEGPEGLVLRRRHVDGAVDGPGLEVLSHRVGVLVGLEQDLVDGGLFAPVRRVLDHLDVAALLPLRALVGTRPDERQLRLVLLGVLDAAPDVLRQHVDPEALHVGLRLGADHLDGVVVDDPGFFDVLRVRRVCAQVLIDDDVVAEGDVLGRDGLAVLPGSALPQVEGPGESVVADVPALGEHALRRAVEVVADEHVVVERPDLVARPLVPDERVEVVGVVRPCEPEGDLPVRGRWALTGGERAADPDEQTGRQQRGEQDEQPPPVHDVEQSPHSDLPRSTLSAAGGASCLSRRRPRRRPSPACRRRWRQRRLHSGSSLGT